MISIELQNDQSRGLVPYVGALAQTCIRRFRDSALLVGANLEQWPAIKESFSRRIDLTRLAPFWSHVCLRYNRDVYDPQQAISFVTEDDPIKFARESMREDMIFSRFIYWRLWPIIASENECVRNILRSVDFLPSQDPRRAVEALTFYIDEMAFSADIYRPDPGYFE